MRYIGTVVSVPRVGVGFIGIRTVTQEDGSYGLATSADIFVHQDECSVPIAVNCMLVFEVAPDTKRGEGYFKAKNADEYVPVELVPVQGPVVPGFTLVTNERGLVVSSDRDPHVGMKEVPEETVDKVEENRPLEGFPRDSQEIRIGDNPEAVSRFLEDYLYTQFPALQSVGLDYHIVGFDAEAQERQVAELAASYREMQMEEEVKHLEEEWGKFKSTREMLVWIWEHNLLRPGTKLSPHVLVSLLKLVEETKTANMKGELVAKATQTVDFMSSHDLLRPNTVIPMRFLTDLFMAVPVWFFYESKREVLQAMRNEWVDADPGVSGCIQYFCDFFPNQRWADTFLIFNRRRRPHTLYKGELIPPHIIRVMREAAAVFDYVVIMTPYHDVAGREWEDAKWLRAIDPYVVGFKKGLPVFFLLGRFSDTGLFPLHTELVADTIEYLRANKLRLKNFNTKNKGGKLEGYAYWLTVPRSTRDPYLLGDCLIAQVDELLLAFDAGHLFDWLRGEWDLPKQVPAPADQPTDLVPTASTEPPTDQAEPTSPEGLGNI